MMKTWVDAAYAVHHGMKSHTGGVMSFGTGVLNATSTKQKLNTKSSPEAELVGASDYLPWTIWVKRFMKYQGYDIKSRTMIVLLKLKKMAENHAVKNQDISTYSIVLSKMFLSTKISKLSIVEQIL